MLALRVDFRWDFVIFVYHACLFSFQPYFSAYHYWPSSLVSLCYCDFYVMFFFLPDLAMWFWSVVWPPFALHLLPDLASSFWQYVFWAKLLCRFCYFIVFCLIWQYILNRGPASVLTYFFYGIWFSVCIVYFPFFYVFYLFLAYFYFILLSCRLSTIGNLAWSKLSGWSIFV